MSTLCFWRGDIGKYYLNSEKLGFNMDQGQHSTYRVFFLLSFCQETWFLMWNSKIPSFLESSWNSLELWNSPGNGQFFTKFDVLGINFIGTPDNFWDKKSKNYSGCLKNCILSILGPNSYSVTKINMNTQHVKFGKKLAISRGIPEF